MEAQNEYSQIWMPNWNMSKQFNRVYGTFIVLNLFYLNSKCSISKLCCR